MLVVVLIWFLNHFTLFSKQGWESLFSLFLTHERFAFYERKVRSFFRANRSFFPLNHTSKGETNFCALLNSSLFSLSLSLSFRKSDESDSLCFLSKNERFARKTNSQLGFKGTGTAFYIPSNAW